MIREAIRKVVSGADLSESEMERVMTGILESGFSPCQVGALLAALRVKGESVDEIAGAARSLRAKIQRIEADDHLVSIDRDDINVEGETILEVGDTGCGGTHIFNVSAASTFVAAAGGIRVVRYGGRSSSSFLGTADVLEYLGINLDISTSDAERSIAETGVGLMFAPVFHNPLRHVSKLRAEMGMRTIFNLIGPLANPAGADTCVLGVYEPDLTEKMAGVIRRLGGKNALVFHGEGTIDEVSTCGRTRLTRLSGGRVETFYLRPQDLGLAPAEKEALRGGNIRQNAEIVRSILGGEKGPRRDLVLVNAAAAFYASGLDGTIERGIARAADAIDSGRAEEKLEAVVRFSQRCVPFSFSTFSEARRASTR